MKAQAEIDLLSEIGELSEKQNSESDHSIELERLSESEYSESDQSQSGPQQLAVANIQDSNRIKNVDDGFQSDTSDWAIVALRKKTIETKPQEQAVQ